MDRLGRNRFVRRHGKPLVHADDFDLLFEAM